MTLLTEQPLLVLPPRPKRAPSTWQLLRTFPNNSVATCDEELFEELFVERRYLWGRVVTISDPQSIRHVLHVNTDNYLRIRQVRRAFAFSSGGSMNHVEGAEHARHRRTINPALHQPAFEPALPRLIEIAEATAVRLAAQAPGRQFEIGRTLTGLITRMSGYIFAGEDKAIDPLLGRLGRFPENYSWLDVLPLPSALEAMIDRYRRARSDIRNYYELVDRLIAERRRPDYAGPDDLLRRLAVARDRETGRGLNAEELRDEVLTLAAGAQAPLRTLTWGWYLLTQFPDAEQRIREELDAVLGDRPLTPADLPKLRYLRRFIDETMRLYPPLPIMLRQAAADDDVCGRRVRRGSYIAIMPWVIHRHRKLWNDPERFDPDRFLPAQIGARPRYAYVPFGVGSHVCVAAALAMNEIVISMAVLARRLRFHLVPGQSIEPTAWSTLRPKKGIMMTVEPRS